MRRLLVLALVLLGGGAALALNAERVMVFFFDPSRVSPEAAGEARLRETVWTGARGEALILWVAPPAGDRPTIFYLHGNAGNLALRAGRFSRFLDRGYGLVALAYPGSSGSSGETSSAAIDRLVAEVYRAIGDLAGPTRVVLYGESLGTGVALQLAAGLAPENPPAGIVLEAPYTSILDIGRQRWPLLAPWLKYLGDPWVSRDNIARVTAPLLILHGSADTTIPPDMGQTLFDLSPAADKTFFPVPGAGHENVLQPEAERTLYRFLARL